MSGKKDSHFLPALLLVPLLAAFGCTSEDDDTPPPPPTVYPWTVMIYGHGDSNLEPSLFIDLDEAQMAGTLDTVEVFVQMDVDSAFTGARRFRLQPGTVTVSGPPLSYTFDLPGSQYTQIAEPDSDSPTTLENFITWAQGLATATRQGLILWNHGGSWPGFGGDDHPSDNDLMDLDEMANALRNALGGQKLEFIAFDCCLMGAAEVLSAMAEFTDTVIACPEIDFGDGWDYRRALADIIHHAGGSTFAASEVASWEAHHFPATGGSSADKALGAHGAYNATALANLETAVANLRLDILGLGSPGFGAVASAWARADHYGSSGIYFDPASNTIKSFPLEYTDLQKFCNNVISANVSAAVTQRAQDLLNALTPIRIASARGTERTECFPLSIWAPDDPNAVTGAKLTDYQSLNFAANTGWDIVMNRFTVEAALDSTPPGLSISSAVNLTNPTPAASATVDFTISGADTTLYQADILEDLGGGNYVLYGVIDTEYIPQGSYQYQWDGLIVGADFGSGPYAVTWVFANPAASNLYLLAQYEEPGPVRTDAFISIDLTNGRVDDLIDRNTASSIEPMTGDAIYLRQVLIDTVGGSSNEVDNGSFPAQNLDSLQVQLADPGSGNYEIWLFARDVYGNYSAPDIQYVTK